MNARSEFARKFRFLLLASCSLIWAALSGSAAAQVNTWYLDGWVFEDGTVADGSFQYDFLEQRIENIQITTVDGPTVFGTTYTDQIPDPVNGFLLFVPDGTLSDFTNERVLYLSTAFDLVVPAGGTEEPAVIEERICDDATCSTQSLLRRVTLGRLTAPDFYVTEVPWYLRQVTFDDGGSASGMFRLGQGNGVYTLIDIATQGGSAATSTYGGRIAPLAGPERLPAVRDSRAPDRTGQALLDLRMARGLRSFGGEVPLQVSGVERSGESTCLDASCSTTEQRRLVTSGEVIAPLLTVRSCRAPVEFDSTLNYTVGIPFDGPIFDLETFLSIDHPWLGDLTVRLEKDGASVTLFDGASAFCSGGSTLTVEFDDDAADFADDRSCSGNPSGVQGTLRPTTPLSAIEGQSMAGNWTLTIENRGDQDGVLIGWCIDTKVISGPTGRDLDGDGIVDASDNCITVPNADQQDQNGNGAGDACDSDADGVQAPFDNCGGIANPDQADRDNDGRGDACDACPDDAGNDIDGDGACANVDICPNIANPGQGPVPFGQMISALDSETFTWASPIGFEGSRGSFTQSTDIGMFAAPIPFADTSTQFRDSSIPPAGTGFWYLFRPSCIGGSYSTGSPSETGSRNAMLTTCDVDSDGFDSVRCGGNDCLDIVPEVNPSETDICNGLDDDCNGNVDDGLCDQDSDGLTDYEEGQLQTDPLNEDTDGDGLSDGSEVNSFGTDPLLADTDSDGLNDSEEFSVYSTDPLVPDTDGDQLSDGEEVLVHGTNPGVPDTDGDGLTDFEEVTIYGTNPLEPDTDQDGLPDGGEPPLGLDPLSADTDNDQFEDLDELSRGTDPLDPDTDDDGLLDGVEANLGTNPLSQDSDNDGLGDADEVNVYGTGPLDPDTDDDSLSDGDELLIFGTNPLNVDSDGDTLDDAIELTFYGTDPLLQDTDADGVDDAQEVANGTDPLDPTSN